jgi:subtilisin family serine protease
MTVSKYSNCCESPDSLRSVIIDALLRAVKDGADVLNLSLGGPNGWTESASSVVASRIAATGKIVAIAASNEVCIVYDNLPAG